MRRTAWLSLMVLLLAGTTQFLLRLLMSAVQGRNLPQAAWLAGGCLIAFVVLVRGAQALSDAWRQRR